MTLNSLRQRLIEIAAELPDRDAVYIMRAIELLNLCEEWPGAG